MNYRFKRFLIDNFDTIGFYTEIWWRTPEKGIKAVERISDQAELADIVICGGKFDGNREVAEAALGKITDQRQLGRIAEENSFGFRADAFQKIKDAEILQRLFKNEQVIRDIFADIVDIMDKDTLTAIAQNRSFDIELRKKACIKSGGHHLDKRCTCSLCGAVMHKWNKEKTCKRCGGMQFEREDEYYNAESDRRTMDYEKGIRYPDGSVEILKSTSRFI